MIAASEPTTAAVASAARPSAAALLGGVSLKAAPKKSSTGKVYPVLPETPVTGELVSRIIDHKEQFDHLEASLKVDKGDLTTTAMAYWFAHSHGKPEAPSSVECRNSATGEQVLIQFQNRYTDADPGAVLDIIGEAALVEHFEQVFSLSISSAKLPADPAIRQQIVDDLTAVLDRYHSAEALSAVVKVKPKSTFHAARHHLLDPDTNHRLQSACPIITMVKTKGRGAANPLDQAA